jgi:hypothetical protein
MIFEAIFSFLGGTAFRMLWGEVSAWLNKKQDHKFEIERLQLQGQLDAAQHGRNLEAIKVQAEMGVQVIRVQGEADIGRIEAQGWLEAVKATNTRTGIWLVDLLNALIRPSVAIWALVMLTLHEFGRIAMGDNTAAVAFAALGIFLADRSLGKRGK